MGQIETHPQCFDWNEMTKQCLPPQITLPIGFACHMKEIEGC